MVEPADIPAAVDPPGSTARRWLYLQLELADLAAVPALLVELLAPWSSQDPGVHRWFHLQYVDATGIALRVRWEVAGAQRARILRELHQLLTVPEVLTIRERMYAPETEKFGGPRGMETAHRIFCAGTQAAIRIHRTGSDPLVAGAALQLALARELGDERARTFLYHYAWYWSGRGALGPLWQQSVRALSQQRVSGSALRAAAIAMLDGPGIGSVLQDFAATFWAEVRALRAADDDLAARLSEAFILHTHQHLIANRIGIVPAQEAHTARLLSVG